MQFFRSTTNTTFEIVLNYIKSGANNCTLVFNVGMRNLMSESSNFIEMHGVVAKIIGGQYTITLTNGLDISGYVSGKMRLHNIRVYEKDLVKIHLSPYDLDQGRIIFRLNPKREQVPQELETLCKKLQIVLPKVEILGEGNES